jgi:hypothetical protein
LANPKGVHSEMEVETVGGYLRESREKWRIGTCNHGKTQCREGSRGVGKVQGRD